MLNLVRPYTPPAAIDWDVFIAHHLTEARAMYAQMKAIPYSQWDAQCFTTMASIRRRIYHHKRNSL